MDRRLAAIVAADVVGYGVLVGRDEEGTIDALRHVRAQIVDPAIAAHNGRIVKLMGDGLLAEFASAADAVRTAHAVQTAMPDWNADRPEDARIVFRVGVNLGDVVIDGDDIQGEGVNIAARLEALSAPGAIAISGAVHEQVRGRLDLDFTSLGPQDLKHVARPVEVWQWGGEAAEPGLALPDKPSIAVLPFDNMSADPDQDFFADGLVEDIITALSRNAELFVIARNSSFSFRGQVVDIREIGRTLGVRYVVEGSVRRAGNRLRITAQLIEAATGSHLWAERYDRPVEDLFDVQDEITMNVVGAVGSEIETSTLRSSGHRNAEELVSWERAKKAEYHTLRATPADNQIAQEICKAEIARTGGSALLFSTLGHALFFEAMFILSERPRSEILAEGIEAGRKAVDLDPTDAKSHAYLSFLFKALGEHSECEHAARTAVGLNPNMILAHNAMGAAVGYLGPQHYDEATWHLKHALRLGPSDHGRVWSYYHLGQIAIIGGRTDEAVEMAREAVRLRPETGFVLRLLAVALALSGDEAQAGAVWEKVIATNDFDPENIKTMINSIFIRPEDAERYLAGAVLAGASLD